MSVVTTMRPRTGRTTELLLLAFALGIVTLAYANVGIATAGTVPVDLLKHVGGMAALMLVFHLVLRWRASYADPTILPIVTLLNGLGLVMLHRLDIAAGHAPGAGVATRQLMWTALSIVFAVIAIIVVRDHRRLRQYTWTMALAGFVLLLMPMLPVLGRTVNGSRIWIGIGPFSFQPGEVAKIALTIFFAGYLVSQRDALSLVGPKVLGLRLPRARDFGPLVAVGVAALLVLVAQKDLGSSLLVFVLFVAMLYIATERIGWVVVALLGFSGAAVLAWRLFGHVQQRVDNWLNLFDSTNADVTYQLRTGMFGMASGGLFGEGLGDGRPYLTPLAGSDFIFPSFGEELGLVGLFAILVLYGLLVERGLRTALGARDGFGKLIAFGLAFSVALQCFVVIGGVTRVIPLTGLTTPFLSAGGSSLLANWVIVAILLRISDQARRPLPEAGLAPSSPYADDDDLAELGIDPHARPAHHGATPAAAGRRDDVDEKDAADTAGDAWADDEHLDEEPLGSRDATEAIRTSLPGEERR